MTKLPANPSLKGMRGGGSIGAHVIYPVINSLMTKVLNNLKRCLHNTGTVSFLLERSGQNEIETNSETEFT